MASLRDAKQSRLSMDAAFHGRSLPWTEFAMVTVLNKPIAVPIRSHAYSRLRRVKACHSGA
jgi:hypothetical protein